MASPAAKPGMVAKGDASAAVERTERCEMNEIGDGEHFDELGHGRVFRLQVVAKTQHRDMIFFSNDVIRVHDRFGKVISCPTAVNVSAQFDDQARSEFDGGELGRPGAVALIAALFHKELESAFLFSGRDDRLLSRGILSARVYGDDD